MKYDFLSFFQLYKTGVDIFFSLGEVLKNFHAFRPYFYKTRIINYIYTWSTSWLCWKSSSVGRIWTAYLTTPVLKERQKLFYDLFLFEKFSSLNFFAVFAGVPDTYGSKTAPKSEKWNSCCGCCWCCDDSFDKYSCLGCCWCCRDGFIEITIVVLVLLTQCCWKLKDIIIFLYICRI